MSRSCCALWPVTALLSAYGAFASFAFCLTIVTSPMSQFCRFVMLNFIRIPLILSPFVTTPMFYHFLINLSISLVIPLSKFCFYVITLTIRFLFQVSGFITGWLSFFFTVNFAAFFFILPNQSFTCLLLCSFILFFFGILN